MLEEGKFVRIHIVQKGETLWNIAQKYGVNFDELKKMNAHLSNPEMIMPGMKIKVPTTGGSVAKKEMPKATHPFAQKKEAPKSVTQPVKEKPKEMPKEQPTQIYQPVMPELQPLPEIDINNYYMLNMKHQHVHQAPPVMPESEEEPIYEEVPQPVMQHPCYPVYPMFDPCYPCPPHYVGYMMPHHFMHHHPWHGGMMGYPNMVQPYAAIPGYVPQTVAGTHSPFVPGVMPQTAEQMPYGAAPLPGQPMEQQMEDHYDGENNLQHMGNSPHETDLSDAFDGEENWSTQPYTQMQPAGGSYPGYHYQPCGCGNQGYPVYQPFGWQAQPFMMDPYYSSMQPMSETAMPSTYSMPIRHDEGQEDE